jgi:c-di-GMP-binding flagellar brake protein YcgR
MSDIEKIQGRALEQLFKGLLEDKTPLKMQLMNGADTCLTYIADIRKRKGALHFLVNAPEGDPEFSAEAGQSRLRFEFIDEENIKYVFQPNTWQLSRAMIWVKFPEFIHRYQRRKLFRLDAPHGTRLYFKVNDIRYKLLVINVSLGGTLGVLVSLTKQMEKELKLYNSKILEDVELLFPSTDRKKAGSIVNIKRCQIKRQEKNPVSNKFECAMEFKEMSEEDQKNLTDLFYRWQRDYLRKRRILRA